MMNLIENKKVHFDYEILETYEAGIELLGTEVKSLRHHQGRLAGSRVIIRGEEAFLVGAAIPPYQPKNAPAGYEETRTRKLLLTKKEIKTLIGKEKLAGLTIVPIAIYNKGRKIKIKIAVVRGKKKYEKRESLKKRDLEKEIGRRLKK